MIQWWADSATECHLGRDIISWSSNVTEDCCMALSFNCLFMGVLLHTVRRSSYQWPYCCLKVACEILYPLKPGRHWRQSRIRHGRLSKVDRVALARYTLTTKSKGRSTFGRQNYQLSTNSTELNMFNFGDMVNNFDRAGDSRLSTNWRQTSDRVKSIGNKVDSRLRWWFVDGFGDRRLCLQCAHWILLFNIAMFCDCCAQL